MSDPLSPREIAAAAEKLRQRLNLLNEGSQADRQQIADVERSLDRVLLALARLRTTREAVFRETVDPEQSPTAGADDGAGE